jgi:hypothetical protein
MCGLAGSASILPQQQVNHILEHGVIPITGKSPYAFEQFIRIDHPVRMNYCFLHKYLNLLVSSGSNMTRFWFR